MKANYFEKDKKEYFSIDKNDKLKDKEIKKNNFDDYKNSTDKYKKTAMRIRIIKHELKD